MAKNTEGQNPCICRASHRRPAWELPCPAGPQPPWDWGACLKCRRSKGPCSVLYEALAIDYRCWYKSVIWTLGRWSCVDHKLKAILGHMESWAWGKPGLPKTLSQNRKKRVFSIEKWNLASFFFLILRLWHLGEVLHYPWKNWEKAEWPACHLLTCLLSAHPAGTNDSLLTHSSHCKFTVSWRLTPYTVTHPGYSTVSSDDRFTALKSLCSAIHVLTQSCLALTSTACLS